MTEPRFVSGSWADVTRTGVVVYARGREIVVGDRVMPAPDELLFVRADMDEAGRLLIAGKAHGDDSCRWWTEARGWRDAGPTQGNYCVEVFPRVAGWVLYVQRDAHRYEVLTIGADGAILARSWAFFSDPQGTAQGFLDATDARLLFTDQSFKVGGTIKPVSCGPYLVGQDGATTLDRVVLSDQSGTPLRVLADTHTESPRAAWLDGRLVMASIAGHQTVIADGRPEDFPLFTEAPPPPDPEPEPEPEPDPMSTPQHIIDTMVACGQRADREQPGLRQRDNDAWMQLAAGYACAIDDKFGRKSRSAGARVSPDTMAYRTSGATMYCVSIIRDNPPVNEWRAAPLDYGLVTDQFWVSVPPVGEPQPEPEPEPPPGALEARVAKLEAWAKALAFKG